MQDAKTAQREEQLTEYRCSCGKLLFKGKLVDCIIEVKCRKCHALNWWKGSA